MGGLQAPRALGHLELHVLVLLEAAEAVAVNLEVVHEGVWAISAGNKAMDNYDQERQPIPCPVHSRPPAVASAAKLRALAAEQVTSQARQAARCPSPFRLDVHDWAAT
jgi:hypothetical protein